MTDNILASLQFGGNGESVDAVGRREQVRCGPFPVGGLSGFGNFEPNGAKEQRGCGMGMLIET